MRRLVLLAVLAWPSLAHALTVDVDRPPPALVGGAVAFHASASGVGDKTFTWDFGDGGEASGTAVTHVYAAPGHYPVIVQVRDAETQRSATFIQVVHRPLAALAPTASSTIVASGERVFLVNPDQDSVSCLDAGTRSLVWERPAGPSPRSLAFAPDGRLWVVNQDSYSISIVSPASGDKLDTIVLPYASRPSGLAFAPDGSAAYVSLQATGELLRIDPATRQISGRLAVGRLPTGVAVDDRRVLVTRLLPRGEQGELVEVDAATFTVRDVIVLAHDPGPDSEFGGRGVLSYLRQVVISPDGVRAWLPAKKDNLRRGLLRDGQKLDFESSVRAVVTQVDLTSGEEVLALRRDLNNRALPSAVAFTPLGDHAFVLLEGTNDVEILDAYSGATVGGARHVGRAPVGLVLLASGDLYVHSFLSRSVIVYDASGVLSLDDLALPRVGEISTVVSEKLPAEVLRGKQIFYDAEDARMTRDGYLSCAVCHLDGFEDGVVWDFTDRGEGLRNTTSLLGKRGAGHGRLHWSANFDEIQDFEHDIRGGFGGKGFLPDAEFHSGTRDTTLGDPKAGLVAELDDLAAYVTSLDKVWPSPFRQGDGSLTAEGLAGEAVFARAGCASCHAGADFTDSPSGVLHDVGTIKPSSGGRLGGPLTGLDTPTLLGVWATAPYLHDGSAATLADVLVAGHGEAGTLDASEKAQLVAYLLQLDQGPPPEPDAPAPMVVDAGPLARPDAGAGAEGSSEAGCGCRSARGGGGWFGVIVLAWWLRRRRR